MTNQEAIKILDEYKHCFWDKLYEPICMAINALEQEPSGDLISRTEVRKFVEYIQSIKDKHNENQTPINYGTICDIVIEGWNLLKLPPVNPQEPKVGHWIAHPKGIYAHLVCDKCLSNAPYDCRTNYCPNCGARMVEAKGESE